MRRHCAAIAIVCLLILACSKSNAADSFASQLEKGNDQLRQGNSSGALDQYRELLTQDPESPLVHFNMGLAHYGEGKNFGELGSTEDAIASLNKAKEEFDIVSKNAPDPKLRLDATYNHANSTAQQAELSAKALQAGKGVVADGEIKASQDLYDLTVKSFEGAVKEYEDLLKINPDHAGAKQNLDHIRYLLKSMLQNPPPPQDQQQQQQQQKEGEGQQQDEQKQGQDQQDKQDQGQQQDQQQKDQQQGEKDQAQQQQAAQANKDQQQDKQDQAQNMENQQQQEGNTEALLQSLEDIDQREQKELKDQQSQRGMVRGNWW